MTVVILVFVQNTMDGIRIFGGMHFPSSDEGAGGDNYSFDHATPTLDVGMQMLQSLEASGDLADTPLSGDSYNVETMETSVDSPSPGHGKKRRIDSGNKYN